MDVGRAGVLPDLGFPAVPADGRGRVRRPAPARRALVHAPPLPAHLPGVLGGVRDHHGVLRDRDADRRAAAASSSTSS